MAQSWTTLKDDDLLKLRICDLDLKIEDCDLHDRSQQLAAELAEKKLIYRPDIYLGDEWFSPEGMLAISIPFYLAHPRLKELEHALMFDVEGGTPESCQRLLRHEAGHCFDHGYRFSKRRKWRDVFGPPEAEYAPETYHPKPYSKGFVQHLDNWYAQAHPDEDFAETFAVWLDPAGDWKKTYRSWSGALKKLSYVDELASEVAAREPIREKGALPFQARKMKSTLGKYYAKRKRENAADYPEFFDDDLQKIFNGDAELSKRDYSAAKFLLKQRKELIDSVAYWTGERKFPIESLVRKLHARSDKLELRMGRTHADTHLQLSAYLATLVTHYLFTGKFKRNV
ncbi:MAG: putative zinc-binding metallopeptidase [Cryobacterium sp.]|nr:putative zinc-binding metallopeptidase [Oligoflexia bacterium]